MENDFKREKYRIGPMSSNGSTKEERHTCVEAFSTNSLQPCMQTVIAIVLFSVF
jgi:hypothetical protein